GTCCAWSMRSDPETRERTTMTIATTPSIPVETDWSAAPGVLEGARELRLAPEDCGLDYWIEHVAGRMLQGLVRGHAPDKTVPEFLRRPGPLREALVQEFAFRSMAEDKAARALAGLLPLAPDTAGLEFFATQIVDEARHAAVFRGHLLELGVVEEELAATVAQAADAD